MSSTVITCKECGCLFELSESEISYFSLKGLNSPKRCKACREKRKENKFECVSSGLSYKLSSFSENAQIYGMPVDVAGGLSKEFHYIICAENETSRKYVNLDEETKRYGFVDVIQNASQHRWSSNLQNICSQLKHRHPEYSFTLHPESSWARLRDGSYYPNEL